MPRDVCDCLQVDCQPFYPDAAKLFLNHPHFMIFPGDRVEVMECLPIPGLQ